MRRRAKEGDVPAHLAQFTEREWPGRTVDDRLRFWREARRFWHEQHGWPGGPLELLAGYSDERRRREGRRLLSWGRPAAELEALDGFSRSHHYAGVPLDVDSNNQRSHTDG